MPRIKEFLAFEACVNSSEGTKMVERVFLSYEARGRIELRKTNGRNTGAGITVTSAVASEHVSLSWRFLARPCFFRAPGKHFLRYVKKISFFLHCRSKIEPLVFTSLFRIFDCNCKSKYQPPPLIPIKKENSQHSLLHKERKKLLNPFNTLLPRLPQLFVLF